MISQNASADLTALVLRSDQKHIVEEEAYECAKFLKDQLHSLQKLVLDFRDAQSIALPALRILTRAVSGLIQQETEIVLLAPKDVVKFIREQGLDRIFVCTSDVEKAIPELTAEKQKTRALEFLNTTLESLAYTFRISTNTEVKAGKSFVRGNGVEPKVDIAAAVGIFSVPFSGSLVLGFPEATYLKVMSRFLGQEYTEINADIQDGVAELLNIILGQAKTVLNQKGYALKQAIPTVSRGRDLRILPANYGKRSVIVPYTTEVGEFYIELTTSPETKSSV